VRESAETRDITLELTRVEPGARKPGRLAAVELKAGDEEAASFTVSRSGDNLHLVTEARLGANVHRGRVLPVRNRSAAHLLSREMEILCNDQIYQDAVGVAASMLLAYPLVPVSTVEPARLFSYRTRPPAVERSLPQRSRRCKNVCMEPNKQPSRNL
jgi:hypothetical protein